MKTILKALQFLYAIYAFILFVALMLLILPLVIVAVFLGQPAGGNLVVHLSRFWSDCWRLGIGIRSRNIVEEPIDPGRHYVFVANHISYMDIPVIFQGVRKNNFRVLGKIEMSRIPIFGTIYRLAVVLVDRSSTAARARSVEVLRKILNQNISIFIFPEGTLNETGRPMKDFYDGAFRIAIETQTPVKPMVFLDTLDRLHYNSIFNFSPGISRVVVLPEISVQGLTLSHTSELKARVFDEMEKCLIRYRSTR